MPLAPSNRQQQLKARNKAFDRLPIHQQRIIVARDVIAQLKAEKYNAAHCYLDITFKDGAKVKESDQLQCSMSKVASCDVCAKGAIFLSTVRKSDNFQIGDASVNTDYDSDRIIGICLDHDEVVETASNVFSERQLDLIECAFEQSHVLSEGSDLPSDVVDAAVTFGSDYCLDSVRLIAICQNIIDNEGIFNPVRPINVSEFD